VRIAEFRRRTGLTRDAVRLYVGLGLLRPARDPANGYQEFAEADVGRVAVIRAAQRLGFSLKQLVPLAREYEAGRMDVRRRLAVMREQLAMIGEQAARLDTMRDYVRAKIAWLEGGERGEPPLLGELRHGCGDAGTPAEQAPRVRRARGRAAAAAGRR